jgi:4-amino-4-deoxy-L-arabinose transferase-like glycosyltransferase
VANAALGALSVLLVFLITSRLWGRSIGLLAAGMAAVFPPLVLTSRDLLTESLFVPVVLAAVLCLLEYRRAARLGWAAAAGVLCGLAILTRNPGPVLLVPLAAGAWFLRPRLARRSLAGPAVLLGCAALVVLPWTVRNAVEFGRFIPVTTGTGYALAGTYNPSSYHDTTPAPWQNPANVPADAALFRNPHINEATLDSRLRQRALSFAWHHPAYVAEAAGVNFLRMFEVTGGSVVDPSDVAVTTRGIGSADLLSERIALAMAAALAVFGGVAIARSRTSDARAKGWRPLSPGPAFMWAVPVLLLVVAAAINGLPRERIPADPFLLMLAAVGAASLARRFGAWGRSAR